MRRVFIDSFSGDLSELPRGKRTIENALHILSDDPLVSCFDRGEKWLEVLLADLQSLGLVIEDKSQHYPWCRFVLTEAGRKMLDDINGSAA